MNHHAHACFCTQSLVLGSCFCNQDSLGYITLIRTLTLQASLPWLLQLPPLPP
jgi:hypothetical protein